MASSDNYIQYRTDNGLLLTPFKGGILSVEADGMVTRDGQKMEEESMVTKAILDAHPEFQEARSKLKKSTRKLFIRNPFALWSVKTSELVDSSQLKCVFHCIMESELTGDWEKHMRQMMRGLLKEVELNQVNTLALPLLGSGHGNASSVVEVMLDCLTEHRPSSLNRVFLVSTRQRDISEVIGQCGETLILFRGNQPRGKMVAKVLSGSLPGSGSSNTIEITYDLPDGTQGPEHPHPGEAYTGFQSRAYLPDSSDGRQVLGMLKVAFDRKLIFTIGRSRGGDAVRWNGILHKTTEHGGKYGYPDPRYLPRLKEVLNKRGITRGGRVELVENIPRPVPGSRRGDEVRLFEQRLRSMGLRIQDNDAKGDCMFKALSQQLELVQGKRIHHKELRRQLVQYLRDNPTTSDGTTKYCDFLKEGESWETYLAKMNEDGYWGDQIMLTAAANKLDVNIKVMKPHAERDTVIDSGLYSSIDGDLMLGHLCNDHFVSIEKVNM